MALYRCGSGANVTPKNLFNATYGDDTYKHVVIPEDIKIGFISWSASKEGAYTDKKPITTLISGSGTLTKYTEVLNTYSSSRGTLSVYLLENMTKGSIIKIQMGDQACCFRVNLTKVM